MGASAQHGGQKEHAQHDRQPFFHGKPPYSSADCGFLPGDRDLRIAVAAVGDGRSFPFPLRCPAARWDKPAGCRPMLAVVTQMRSWSGCTPRRCRQNTPVRSESSGRVIVCAARRRALLPKFGWLQRRATTPSELSAGFDIKFANFAALDWRKERRNCVLKEFSPSSAHVFGFTTDSEQIRRMDAANGPAFTNS